MKLERQKNVRQYKKIISETEIKNIKIYLKS